jgi:hypothetical protein
MPKSRYRPSKSRSLPLLASVAIAPPDIRLANHSAMRSEWVDVDDITPDARRTAKTVTGYRQYCLLRKCRLTHGEHSHYTNKHILAADRLRALADAVVIGFSTSREYTPVQAIPAYGPRTGFGQAALRSAKAWPAYRRAMTLFDQSQRDLITHCLLLNWSLQRWVAYHREQGRILRPLVERQRLLVILDILVEHFKSEIARDLQHGAA